jgi:hypothetical protein
VSPARHRSLLVFSVLFVSLLLVACGDKEKDDQAKSRGFELPIQKVTLINQGGSHASLDVLGSAKGVANTKTLWAEADPGTTGTSTGMGQYCDSADVWVTFGTGAATKFLKGSGSWPSTTPPTTILEVTVTAKESGGQAKLKILGREETLNLQPWSPPVASSSSGATPPAGMLQNALDQQSSTLRRLRVKAP